MCNGEGHSIPEALMSSSYSRLHNRTVQTARILDGLATEQATQMSSVLIRCTELELSALVDKRMSYALGAALDGV